MSNSTLRCPSCGSTNEAGSRFCTTCGQTTEPRVFCASCNQPQAVGNRFCMRCGADIAGGSWEAQPATGAVIQGVWERGPGEFIRRVDPEDCRSFLGNRTVRVPAGTVGAVLVDGVVDRVLPPGEQTSLS